MKRERLTMIEHFRKPMGYVLAAMFVFVAVNLYFRFYAGFHYLDIMLSGHADRLYVVLITVVVVLSVAGLMGIVWFSKYLKAMLFIFGLSFALFGFQPYTPYSQFFDVLVTFGALALLMINFKERRFREINERFLLLLLLYVSLSGLSLLQLPLVNMFKGFALWGASWSFLIIGAIPPWDFYATAGVNRLVLFVIFVVLLSRLEGNRGFYRAVFLGALWGAVLAAVVGLLDYYGVISLAWFRVFNPKINPGGVQFRLQSIFGHPGWFAEFVTVTIPFILMGFLKKDQGFLWKTFLFGILVLCEIALILAKSRAGWISYPMTLTFCWISVYLLKEGEGLKIWHIKKKDIIKIAISVPITIILSLFIVFKLFGVSSSLVKEKTGGVTEPSHIEENLNESSNAKSKSVKPSNAKPKPRTLSPIEAKAKADSLESRVGRIFHASDRTHVWKQGWAVGWERPIFGMGYESFGWHKGILEKVETSNIRRNGSYVYKYDTPHNLYLQLFVSGGGVGLLLWGLLIAYVMALLIADLIKNNRYFNVCVALSIVSFHVYGVFQSMQYIPMIWFLIFLMFGYALTIDDDVLPLSIRRLGRFLSIVGVLLVFIGGIVYLYNYESRNLVEKYGLEVYRKDQDKHRYFGFYPLLLGKYSGYRWSGKRAEVDINGGGTVEIDFRCDTPGVEKDPVVLSVYQDQKLLDTVTFTKKGTIRRKYTFPEALGKPESLTLEVSRTWNPHKVYGNFDRKDLGVGMKLIEER